MFALIVVIGASAVGMATAYLAFAVLVGKFIATGMGSREAERQIVRDVFDGRKA